MRFLLFSFEEWKKPYVRHSSYPKSAPLQKSFNVLDRQLCIAVPESSMGQAQHHCRKLVPPLDIAIDLWGLETWRAQMLKTDATLNGEPNWWWKQKLRIYVKIKPTFLPATSKKIIFSWWVLYMCVFDLVKFQRLIMLFPVISSCPEWREELLFFNTLAQRRILKTFVKKEPEFVIKAVRVLKFCMNWSYLLFCFYIHTPHVRLVLFSLLMKLLSEFSETEITETTWTRQRKHNIIPIEE